MLSYLSLFSGIEAATQAWDDLGFRPIAFSEIDPFPSAVLAHHYPDVPNLGDISKHKEWDIERPDIIVGGSPCQAFSIAGLRKGLDDERGNLTFTYLETVAQYRPNWLVWENVPGVLSDDEGATFGAFIGGLGELGYGFAYRVLDAKHFGVPQRRRRVFVVGCLGNWQRAAAVLFNRESLRGYSEARRRQGENPACETAKCLGASIGGIDREDKHTLIPDQPYDVANCLTKRMHKGINTTCDEGQTPVLAVRTANTQANGIGVAEEVSHCLDGANGQAIAFSCKDHGNDAGEVSPPLRAMNHDKSHANAGGQVAVVFKPSHYTRGKDGEPYEISPPLSADADRGDQDLVAFTANQRDEVRELEVAGAVSAQPGVKQQTYLKQDMHVRRLTPRECERLQGFPDDFTQIAWRGKAPADCPDGPRYKALGNSMAVPVMRWIGERILEVEKLGVHDR